MAIMTTSVIRVELAKRHDALVIGIAEIADYLGDQGQDHGMSIGGAFEFDFGKVKLRQLSMERDS